MIPERLEVCHLARHELLQTEPERNKKTIAATPMPTPPTVKIVACGVPQILPRNIHEGANSHARDP